jgi:diaminopimelate decarboxylase
LIESEVNPEGITLQVEPGRSLFADAGVHLAKVCHIKSQRAPIEHTWIEVDTTEMFLPDLFVERARFMPIFASQAAMTPDRTAHIVGVSCGYDLLAQSVRAPLVSIGDVVAFLDTGAYQDAAASNFNALPRPATVLVRGDRSRLVKRRESISDIFARDICVQ